MSFVSFVNMLKLLLLHFLNQTFNFSLYNFQLYELYKLSTNLLPSVNNSLKHLTIPVLSNNILKLASNFFKLWQQDQFY